MVTGTNKMELLHEAIERLERSGFRREFRARPDGTLRCGSQEFAPEALEVEEIVRFEGQSDPADQAILFALAAPCAREGAIRGTFLARYGPGAEPAAAEALRRLRHH